MLDCLGVHVGEVVLECDEVFVESFRVREWDGNDSWGVFLWAVPLVVVESNVGPTVVGSSGVADGVVHGLGAVLEFVLDVRVRIIIGWCVVDRVRCNPFDADVEFRVGVRIVAVSKWGFGADRGERSSVLGPECFVAEGTSVSYPALRSILRPVVLSVSRSVVSKSWASCRAFRSRSD